MKQQINLYQECLIEKKSPLRTALMLGIFVSFVVVLTGAVIFISEQNKQMASELQQVQQEQMQLAAEFQDVKMQNPARQKDPQLKQELERKQAALGGRKPLLAYLEHFNPGMTTGFSPVLEGLARYPLKGVWLTEILLNRSKQQILLAGSAIKADLIPAYLQHLGDKKVLSDQTFARLKLTRVKAQNLRINFRLESDFGAADE